MASSGKKGKSKKGVTLAWNDFVADAESKSATYAPPNRSLPRKSSNWADDVEDDHRKEKVVLPSGPRATWGLDLDDSKIPKSPPFLAYISNLPYEVEEDEIEDFFKDMKIVSVRLPREERPGRHRGFGYVEFETRQCLIEALSLPDTNIKGRRIRIEVAAENDRRRGRDGMRSDRPSNYDAERSAGDWRAGPREGPLGESDRDRGRGSGFITRDREPGSGFITRDRDPGSSFLTRDREPGSGFITRDREPGSGFITRDREPGSGFITRDRDSGFASRDGPRREFGSGGFREGFDRDRGGGFRDNREGFGERERGSSWFSDRDDRDRGRGFGDRDSFGGDRDRGRFGDRERDREGGFGPPRREYGRDGFRSDGKDDLPPIDKGEPRTRPKLNLQPRSKPVEEAAAPPAAPAPSGVSGAPASIFGGAKPVDTAARERMIEERLAKERGDTSRPEKSDDRPRGRDDSREPRDGSRGPRDDSRGPRDGSRGPRDDSRPRDGSRGPSKPTESGRENFWTQRSRQNGPPDNGRSSPHSDQSDNQERRDDNDSQIRLRSRPETPEGRSRSGDSHDGRSESQHSNYKDDSEPLKHDDSKLRECDDLGPREERGRSGRNFPDAQETSSTASAPDRGSRGDKEETKSRGSSQTKDGDAHKEKAEHRMPQFHEQEAPNFVGSNKFAYLHSDEEDH